MTHGDPNSSPLARLIAKGEDDIRNTMSILSKADNDLENGDPNQTADDLEDDFDELDELKNTSDQANAQATENPDGTQTDPGQAQPGNPDEGQPGAKPTVFVKADGEEFIPVDAAPLLQRLAEVHEATLGEVRALRAEVKELRGQKKQMQIIAKAVQSGMDGMLSLTDGIRGIADNRPLPPAHRRQVGVPTLTTLPEISKDEVFAKADEAMHADRLSVDDVLFLNSRVNSVGVAQYFTEKPAIARVLYPNGLPTG